jgi:hypothetical protein
MLSGSRSARLLSSDDGQFDLFFTRSSSQFVHGSVFKLTDTFLADPQTIPNCLERHRLLVPTQAEVIVNNGPFPIVKTLQYSLNAIFPLGLRQLFSELIGWRCLGGIKVIIAPGIEPLAMTELGRD